MKSIQLLLAVLLTLLIISIEGCPSKSACPKYVYKYYEEHKDILSKLPDYYQLSKLSLIGTHQSMTFSSSDIEIRKQELNITQQLIYGVRVFDINVRIDTNYFGIYYQDKYLGASFNNLVYEIDKFLRLNSQEFVILIINIDHKSIKNPKNVIDFRYCDILNDYITKKYVGWRRIILNWSFDDKLLNFRGKILLGTYEIPLLGCANWLNAKCLLTNSLTMVGDSFVYNYFGDNSDNKNDIDDSKWKKYIKFIGTNALNYYPCYIYDLSIDDRSSHHSSEAAKYGGYDINGKCFVPINYRIDNYCRGDHRSGFNIFILDYVTQEIINHINEINYHFYNPFETA